MNTTKLSVAFYMDTIADLKGARKEAMEDGQHLRADFLQLRIDAFADEFKRAFPAQYAAWAA